MKRVTFDYSNVFPFVNEEEIHAFINENNSMIKDILNPVKEKNDDLGWVNIDGAVDEKLLLEIEEKASEIRENADIFLLIGVGGSNQGARAVIESIGDKKIKVLYAGNNLSPDYLNKIILQLKGKSVYVDIIAKNFATLEPGITFRVIRKYMEDTYGQVDAAKRIIATGSLNGSSLEVLGREKGYTLMPFPLDIGGRFSVLSAVGLLPIAVSGVDIRELLKGAKDIKKIICDEHVEKNPAVLYGVARNILLNNGYSIEILSSFEPMLGYFSKWWVQLFGESEGKDGKGLFPTACSFSEDLHSLGQYIQSGKRILIETFINIEDQGSSYMIPHEKEDIDGFAYIDSKDFAYLNSIDFKATIKAHVDGGVPCMVFNVPKLTPYYMGQLFYFFQYACYISASILGVNPFDQPGVEAYKANMFASLGKFK